MQAVPTVASVKAYSTMSEVRTLRNLIKIAQVAAHNDRSSCRLDIFSIQLESYHVCRIRETSFFFRFSSYFKLAFISCREEKQLQREVRRSQETSQCPALALDQQHFTSTKQIGKYWHGYSLDGRTATDCMHNCTPTILFIVTSAQAMGGVLQRPQLGTTFDIHCICHFMNVCLARMLLYLCAFVCMCVCARVCACVCIFSCAFRHLSDEVIEASTAVR